MNRSTLINIEKIEEKINDISKLSIRCLNIGMMNIVNDNNHFYRASPIEIKYITVIVSLLH
jgi:hypothetical protein